MILGIKNTKRLVLRQVIVVGTDGIWEALNSKGDMFGKQRLQNIIKENHHLSAQGLLDFVYSELNAFTFGAKSEDDITLVIIFRQIAMGGVIESYDLFEPLLSLSQPIGAI